MSLAALLLTSWLVGACCSTEPEPAPDALATDVRAASSDAHASGLREARAAILAGRPSIRYSGFPHGPALDPETGLPRECTGCLTWPGTASANRAYNAEMRRAVAAGEIVVVHDSNRRE